MGFDRETLSGSTVEERDAQKIRVQRSNLAEYQRQRLAIDPETIIEGETKFPVSIFGKKLGSNANTEIVEFEPVISRTNTKLLLPDLGESENVASRIVEIRQSLKELRDAA